MPKNNQSTRSKGRRSAPRRGRERHLSVRSERRAEPDLHKIAKAVVSLAFLQAQAEADAQAQTPTTPTQEADR